MTVGGAEADVPCCRIRRLDFSAGNVVYLSDLPFESVECTPYVDSRLSPQRDRAALPAAS